MGRALFDLDKLEESRDAVEKALSLVPGGRNEQLESFLRMVKQRIPLTKAQIAALDRSSEINSQAVELVQEGDFEGAIELFKQAVEVYVRSAMYDAMLLPYAVRHQPDL